MRCVDSRSSNASIWINAFIPPAAARRTRNRKELRGKFLFNAHQSNLHTPTHDLRTLLQLRTGCQKCGHQASLHRKLTSIDRYIQDEVKKAKKIACRHLILMREIPRSPLFEPYDLIPLPSDDQCTSENHASYTCAGIL